MSIDNQQYTKLEGDNCRFHVSIREGLQPAGREFLTNQQPDRPNEPDCYDTGDGFYNPTSRCIIMARDPEDAEYLNNLKKKKRF